MWAPLAHRKTGQREKGKKTECKPLQGKTAHPTPAVTLSPRIQLPSSLWPPIPSYPPGQNLEAAVKVAAIRFPSALLPMQSGVLYDIVSGAGFFLEYFRIHPSPPSSLGSENANQFEQKPEQTVIRKVNPTQK